MISAITDNADDRIPTTEELQKLLVYPDRESKPLYITWPLQVFDCAGVILGGGIYDQ